MDHALRLCSIRELDIHPLPHLAAERFSCRTQHFDNTEAFRLFQELRDGDIDNVAA